MQRIGRYEVTGELGRGAMGVVYRANDPTIGRTVAVKSIRLSEIADPKELEHLRERLLREAQSAGILSHPGIVTVFDVAEDEKNAYIFMEFVDGDTLESLLAAEEPPSGEALIQIFRETASALDYAHRKGIIHRDIKPANLMITSEGTAKIADFGVAKIVSQQMTVPGMVLGTPFYMSPEQVQGGRIDGRSDQFSLGVMVFEILTGQRPYTADTLATLILKIVTEKPPAPESLNPALDASVNRVFEKVLAKSPDDRYPSCVEFVEDLARTLEASRDWKPVVKAAATGMTERETAATVADVVVAPPRPEAEIEASAEIAVPTVPPPWDEPSEPEPALRDPSVVQPGAPTPAPVSGGGPKAGSRKKIFALAAVVVVVAVIALIAWTQFGPESGALDVARTPVVELPETPAPVAATPPPAKPEPPKPAPTPVVREREVTIDSDPPGATVVLDNDPELTCVTPCPVTLADGRHTMSMRKEGHREVLKIFETPKEVEIRAVLERMAGSLALQSTPPGATISINGEVMPERTPTLISLTAGTYDLILSLEGFPDYRDTLEIKDRVVANLNVEWE